MRRPASLLVALAVLAAIIAACGGSNPDVSPTTTQAVTMRGNGYAPAHVAVTLGSTVTWTNEDEAKHDVVFDGDDERSQLLAKGESYERAFTAAGTYDYVCSVHPSMRGRVTVRASAPGAS